MINTAYPEHCRFRSSKAWEGSLPSAAPQTSEKKKPPGSPCIKAWQMFSWDTRNKTCRSDNGIVERRRSRGLMRCSFLPNLSPNTSWPSWKPAGNCSLHWRWTDLVSAWIQTAPEELFTFAYWKVFPKSHIKWSVWRTWEMLCQKPSF